MNVSGTNLSTQPRSAVFTVYQNGGDGSRNRTITITQAGKPTNVILIDQATVDDLKIAAAGNTNFKPFNYWTDKEKEVDIHGNSATYQLDEPYFIEVEETQSSSKYEYASAYKVCKNQVDIVGKEPRRIPILIELFAMWRYCKGSGSDATSSTLLGAQLKAGGVYFSTSRYGATSLDRRSRMSMNDGKLSSALTNSYVRCIREIK